MSYKLSKSDKSKSKFAQSNINYVYKGNTTESNHKPTVRQYGMQVVGKLQGTRRLPPPAWVPSIKAESGGLDSRVAIVPAGGSGWGVASTTTDLPNSDDRTVTSTEVSSTTTTTSGSILNGSVGRMTIENSFEPAYTRVNVGTSGSDISGDKVVTQANTKVPSVESEDAKSLTDTEARDSTTTTTADKTSSSTRRFQPTSGGLAANKPFFHRPVAPVPISANQPSDAKSELPNKTTGGASEVLGSPAGWAAVGDQEPNFDEKILFSDEDEDLAEPPKGYANQPPRGSGSSTPSVAKSPNGPQAPKSDAAVNQPSSFTGYAEHMGKPIHDVWTSLEDSQHLNSLNNQSSARHVLQQSFEARTIGLDDSTMLPNQCLQRPVPPSFRGPLPPHVLPEPILAGDTEAEVQNVQRRVRTQEFKSAVERAQQARLVRQKSDGYGIESDVVHRSLAGLLSEFDDAKVHALSTSSHGPTLPATNSSFPQLLLSSVYQQLGNQTPPDLATALAAAKAVALACNETTNPSSRSGGAPVVLPPSMPSPVGSGPWHDQVPISAQAPSTLYNVRPPVLPTAPGSVPQPHLPAGSAANAVLLNPQHFVERFLQLLKQQQQQQSVKSAGEQPFSVQRGQTPVSMHETRSNNLVHNPPSANVFVKEPVGGLNSDVDSQSTTSSHVVKSASMPKSDSPDFRQASRSVPPYSDTRGESNVTQESIDSQSQNKAAQHKRVPGLMEVKVSSTSPHLSSYWDQNDAGLNARHRNKLSNDRGRVFTKNRHQVYRHTTDDPKNNRERPLDDSNGRRMHESSHTRTWQLSKETNVRSHAGSDHDLAKTGTEDGAGTKSAGGDLRASSESLNDMSEEKDTRINKGHADDRRHVSTSNRRAFVSVSKAHHEYGSGPVDYHRPTAYSRRGRGSYSHAPGSRTFVDDEASARYNYSDSKPQSGGSFRKVHASTNGRVDDAAQDYRHKVRVDSQSVSWSHHRGRGMHQPGHRDYTRFSHNQRPYSSNSDARRHRQHTDTRPNPPSKNFRHPDEQFGDDDGGETVDRRPELSSSGASKAEQHDNRPADERVSDVVNTTEAPKQSDEQSVAKVLDEFDQSDDIPTVRVPATEMGFGSKASSYSRRIDPSHRSTSSRRGVSRMGPPLQQGTKRYGTSTVPLSRRYREMRHRYRDEDDDDDGGAAAGGAGNSASAGKYSGQNDPNSRSQTGSRIKPSGGRGASGGSQDSNVCSDACALSPVTKTGCTNHNNSIPEHSAEHKVRPNFNTSVETNRHPHPRSYHTESGPTQRSGGRRFNDCKGGGNHCPNLTEIPPLMSIKPMRPFSQNSVGYEAKLKSTCEVSEKSSAAWDSNDGFTEVVGKSHRKPVRRQSTETTAAAAAGSKATHQRSGTNKPDAYSADHKSTISKRTNVGPSGKYLDSKSKSSSSLKPTFMGPPLPSASCSEPSVSTPAVVEASFNSPSSTSGLLKQTTTRTWSKVVGTKTVTNVGQCSDVQSDCPSPSQTNKDSVEVSTSVYAKLSGSIQHRVPTTTNNIGEHNWTGVTQDFVSHSVTSASSSTAAVSTSTVNQSLAVVSNNVCKVKPQQQQQPPLLVSSTMSIGQAEAMPITAMCSSDLGPSTQERVYDTNLDVTPTPKAIKDNSQLPDNPVPLASEIFSGQLPPTYDVNRFGMMPPTASNVDSQFPSTFWQPPDPSLDGLINRYSSSNVALPFTPMSASDVLSNVLTGPTGSSDNAGKTPQQQGALLPRNHSYASAYAAPTSSSVAYGNPLEDSNKNSMSGIPHSHGGDVLTPPITGAMFMPNQQHSTGHVSHPFSANWTTVPQGPHLQQQVMQPQRYRQRPPDQSAFNNFTYQSKLQNEFGFMPPITGCIPPGPSSGLYSTIQGHSGFPHNPARPTVPSGPTHNPWSILGNSSVTPSLLAPNPEYGNVTFGASNEPPALLPHPQNGYTGTHGTVPPPSSSSNPNLLAHQNFFGMLGNERQLVGGGGEHQSMRQRMYSSRSPNTQTPHPPLQVHHSTFYPSLSPSHQRLQLQQFAAGSHNRSALPGLINPHNGLFAAPFGAQQVQQSATPPIPAQGMGPIKLFSSPFLPAT